ncbi:MAG TPA: FAD-dependent oxidoreductase [Anaerolineales bacterium]|nr:FAD-dependent oxidoreductase [Anaerolineales bacterium]
MTTPPILICGAGIAGISAAYHLAVRHGIEDIILVDERPPLSLTSDKSTECYRNWWPGPGNSMVSMMNRSIDLLEELAHSSRNAFHLNRRGYLYLTATQAKIPEMISAAEETSRLGAGPLRIHQGLPGESAYLPPEPQEFASQPTGADLLLDPALIHYYFPYISEDAVAALHVRRAGWFSAQQLGAYLLDQARAHGVRLVKARLTGIDVNKGRVNAVHLDDASRLEVRIFVNAAGPYLNTVSQMVGIDLPVYCELHFKVGFKDHLGAVPRDAPLLIWADPQTLSWTPEEQQLLSSDDHSRWLLNELPPGVHTRPEGPADSPIILMLWEYHTKVVEPVWPPPLDFDYPEIALRGLATMIPALRSYISKAPRPALDGGYYTRTRENRPLIGPLPVEGTYVIGALSGFGLMASLAAGELLTAHLTGSALPPYAPAFSLSRYDDPTYQQLLTNWGSSGQL